MQKYLPVLRNCPFFTGLTDDEILSILHCVSAAKITRPRGSYIFRAGDSTEVMGLVLSGSTLVIQEDLWGHRNILSKCNTGDFFGEPYAATPGAILNISVVAEEDCEILLLNVNNFDRSTDISDPEQETSPEGANCIRQFLHTIEHEFAHILHQTTMFDKTYESISAGKYNPTGWTDVEYAEAQSLGFITPYAMSGKDEDFVEMISVIMVYGREWYDDMVQKTCFQNGKLVNETAYDAFTRKEAIVVDYLKNVWGIKFYDDAEGEGIVTYVQEAINKQLGK